MLGRMDIEQLRQVVLAPLDSVSELGYEPGLVDRVLADAGTEPGVLSSLGLLLQELWHRRRDGLLSHQAYDELGDGIGVLRHYAERARARCVRQEDMGAARRLFTRLVRVPWRAGSATRRAAERSELGDDEWRVALRLADARLLVVSLDVDGSETVELAHAALITGWPMLATWVAEGPNIFSYGGSPYGTTCSAGSVRPHMASCLHPRRWRRPRRG